MMSVLTRKVMSSASSRLRLLQGHVIQSAPCRGMTSSGAERVLSTRTRMDVGESYISYLDTAIFSPRNEQTVLFLHGNPTAAYLWRNIIPHVQGVARCVAPDLLGQGHSGKEPRHQYRFQDHYRYLSEWIDKMSFPGQLHLVIHDWGSGLGFHWANQHRDRVASITFMEALVGPVPGWDGWPEAARRAFQNLRSPAGEEMVIQKNFFVEKLLPGSIIRQLSEEEMAEYRRPFLEPGESRRPTLTWPREIPVMGEGPQDTVDITMAYYSWLASEERTQPLLYIDGDPGFFSAGIRQAVSSWPRLQVAKVKGLHFLQEDSPDQIGHATREFITGLNK